MRNTAWFSLIGKWPISFISMNSPFLICGGGAGAVLGSGEVVVVAGQHHHRALVAVDLAELVAQVVVDRVEVQVALERLGALGVVEPGLPPVGLGRLRGHQVPRRRWRRPGRRWRAGAATSRGRSPASSRRPRPG